MADRDVLLMHRERWTTQSADDTLSARYGPAINSAFELGKECVDRYGWSEGDPVACYGRVQRFFFVCTGDSSRAVLLAGVHVFGRLEADPLTGLPVVDAAHVTTCSHTHLDERVFRWILRSSPLGSFSPAISTGV